MLYFEMDDDVDAESRWWLNGLYDARGHRLDSRFFRAGAHIGTEPSLVVPSWSDGQLIEVTPPMRVNLRHEGRPLDLTFADFDMPVASRDVACLLKSVAGDCVEVFPVEVSSHIGEYAIVNIATTVQCLDVERSEIDWWEVGNPVRPDLAGEPRIVSQLIVDSARIGGRHVFRPQEIKTRVIVSETVMRALVDAGATGVRFHRVSA